MFHHDQAHMVQVLFMCLIIATVDLGSSACVVADWHLNCASVFDCLDWMRPLNLTMSWCPWERRFANQASQFSHESDISHVLVEVASQECCVCMCVFVFADSQTTVCNSLMLTRNFNQCRESTWKSKSLAGLSFPFGLFGRRRSQSWKQSCQGHSKIWSLISWFNQHGIAFNQWSRRDIQRDSWRLSFVLFVWISPNHEIRQWQRNKKGLDGIPTDETNSVKEALHWAVPNEQQNNVSDNCTEIPHG